MAKTAQGIENIARLRERRGSARRITTHGILASFPVGQLAFSKSDLRNRVAQGEVPSHDRRDPRWRRVSSAAQYETGLCAAASRSSRKKWKVARLNAIFVPGRGRSGRIGHDLFCYLWRVTKRDRIRALAREQFEKISTHRARRDIQHARPLQRDRVTVIQARFSRQELTFAPID